MRKRFRCMIKLLNWIVKIQMHTKIKVFECIYNLGDTFHNLKLYKEALRMYDKAIELDP